MNMKVRFPIIALFLLLCVQVSAQEGGSARFKASYERQVRNVGPAGVGVETIIDRWEAAEPQDPDVYAARFNWFFAKSKKSEVVPKDARRYLGEEPMLTLKDSLGRDIYYFEVPVFEDSLYADGMRAIDKAVSLRPGEFRYRFYKITSLMEYEGESPDMAFQELMSLIDEYVSSKGEGWTLDGKLSDDEVFCQAVGEYCYAFFHIGTQSGYEYFYSLSGRMNRLYPRNTVFIDNLGSYWQVARKNPRKAMKYYKKALKINPEDYAAKKNMSIIQLSQSKKGRSSK